MSDEGRLVAGRYRLIERIGRGGMGTVWRAEDETLSREIALKRLHAQHHLTDDELATVHERTRREARSAARIAHPNVVVVHDVVDDDGLPCIVMEYVPGTDLGSVLKDGGAVPPAEAARVGLGMVAALRAAHAAGVLHRDVKPGNVLLDAAGRVVLTDFGIAMTTGTSTLTKTGELVGSVDYIAPERMKGEKPGPATDLWALGATLFQSVEGRPPFRKDTAVETAYAIAVDPLAPMRRAGALEPLIARLLAKDPRERPSADETERALRAVVSGAVPVGPEPRSAPVDAAAEAVTGPVAGPATGQVTGQVTGRATSVGDTLPAAGRGNRRRTVVRSAVAVALAAAAVAGGLYVMSADHGDGTRDSAVSPSPGESPTGSRPPAVPEGLHLVEEKELGASFPVPDGWRRDDANATAEQVTYTDESALVGLTINTVNPAGDNPETHFENIEANTKLNYDTYRKLRMLRTTFRGRPAAVWEFTFEGRVRAFRAIDFGFGEEGGTEYDIYLSAPEARWDTHRPVFDKVKAGFRVH
ncbi:protein kinase [Streptomyces sp. NPDC059517]|uniref:serine/threonine-protein kinase n=1 Tax=Streptomyces sp. NPDC059517 TaxID=3346855 RepID=UPI0036895603